MTILVLCCLIFQCTVLLELTAADPVIYITPTQIDVGLSDSLNVNCTFSIVANPSMSALISLILSRANSTGQTFTELATISSVGHNANMLTTESAAVSGVFSAAAVSFLNMRWDYPVEAQSGVFQCTAQGVDPLGHIVVMTDFAQVTAVQPTVDDWREKVKEMDIRMKLLEQKMASFEKERLNNISLLFEDPLTHNNHKYYISRDPFTSIEMSYAVCHVYGGWLVVIDDSAEYIAIQNRLKFNGEFLRVVISGTDEGHEGNWTLPFTSQPLPFVDWDPDKTSDSPSQNCLVLSNPGWQMADWLCQSSDLDNSVYRYMCEIPV